MKKVKENNEHSYGRGGEVIITIYHVTWCPYSKKAIEVWNTVKDSFNGKTTKGGKTILLEDINPEEEGTEPIVNGKEIEAYPTIYCNIGKEKPQIEFKSKCTDRALRTFLEDIKNNY